MFRVVQLRKYSPNSRCHPSSYLLTVLAIFLAIFSPSSYSWNEWNVRHLSSSQPKQLNLVARSSRLTVHYPARTLHFWRHFLAKHKILPNLVISNWLWWIKRVLLANQNWGKYLPPTFKPVLQQISLLEVAWILTSDWIKLRKSNAIHRNYNKFVLTG